MSPQVGRKGTKVNPWELTVNLDEYDYLDEYSEEDNLDEEDEGDRWDVYPYNVQKH